MSLKGNLASVNLTEIFQMLSLSGREGTLFIYGGARKRAICFTKDGVSIRSRDGNETNLIGKILVRLGRVEENRLQRAIEDRRATDRLLGDVLVEMGACTREDVELAFHIQSEEDIQELFLARSDAQFEYVDGFFPESEAPFVNLNVNSLLIEIARRTDEWEYIRRRVRGPREIYRFTGVEGTVDADVIAECYAHRIDPLIDGTRSAGEIMDHSYVNRFDVCKLLAAYLDAGVIEPVPPDAIRQNARLALRMGDPESAIRHYEYVLSSGDFPLDVMSEAAEAHEALRDFAEAAALLRRLSEELVRAGDYRGAIDSLRRVANYPRPQPEALRYLMDLVFDNPRDAAEFASHVTEAAKTLVAYLRKHDRKDEALTLLTRLLETFPDEVAFALTQIGIHKEDGRLTEAVALGERCAASYLKRRKTAEAVIVYKKLLLMDPDRKDLRDRVRKLTTTRRKSPGALPRIAVALAISLLLGGAAVVILNRQRVESDDGGVDRSTLNELVGRAANEQAQASAHGERAVRGYTDLAAGLDKLSPDDAAPLRTLMSAAEESYELFDGHAERTLQMARTIRTQTSDQEIRTRADSMARAIENRRTKVGAARRQWRTAAQAAAVRQFESGRAAYTAGRLGHALKLFGLAHGLSTRPEWNAEVSLDRYITNIRSDLAGVQAKIELALEHERQGAWTTARGIYLELIQQFPNTSVARGIRLPVELLTIPPGAAIELDGNEIQQKTPTFVHVDPFRETVVVLKKKTFENDTLNLGPFKAGTDPAKYEYPRTLMRAATWTRDIDDNLESTPAVWQGSLACAGRSGYWYMLDAKTGKHVGGGKADTFDGVAAGVVTDGPLVFIPSLDGKLFAIDGATRRLRHTFTGFGSGLYATPAVNDGVIYVVDDSGRVTAFDLKTTKELWRASTPPVVRAAVVVHGEDLVVVSASGQVTVLRKDSGKEVARYKLEGTFHHAPAVAGPDDLVFASDSGQVYGVARVTGQIRWQHHLKAPVNYTSPIRGRVAFFSPKPGELIAIDTQTGDVNHATAASESARVELAASDRIFFAHGNAISAFARGTDGYGIAWSFVAKGRILAGPVVDSAGGAVYFSDNERNLYRLEADD